MHEQVAEIAKQLLDRGFAITPHFLDENETLALIQDSATLWNNGAFRPARIGLGTSATVHSEIRSDRVYWLEDTSATDAQRCYLHKLSALREAVNRSSFAGLFDWEGHLAVYPAGAFYRPHLDRFDKQSTRVVTTVLYLNPHWIPEMGGALRIWLEAGREQLPTPQGPFVDVAPRAGTLVTFWSDTFVHEVLESHAERMSITGWFRLRSDDLLRQTSMG